MFHLYKVFVNLFRMMKFHRLKGIEARKFLKPLAELRLKVFWDYPYLYEGSPDYEKKYLETYFKAEHSFIFLIEDSGRIIGATTGILASEEEDNFKKPFLQHGLNPQEVFYFGESVLLPEYRGRGFGKLFFEEREKYARSLTGVKVLSFCAVERASDHPEKPHGYRGLDTFWQNMGFHKEPGLTTTYSWKDRNEKNETPKKMQYWIKTIQEKK